jgi:hypothetical protein
MKVVQWAQFQVGRRVTAPGGLGGQCVDLCNVYLAAAGAALVRRNAAQWADAGAIAGWQWVANGPANYPSLGDAVVWRANVTAHQIGPDGHVAVCMAADSSMLITLDQNWAQSTVVALEWHDYIGVAGWWHPPR